MSIAVENQIQRMQAAGYAASWNTGGAWIIEVEGPPPTTCPLCGDTLTESEYLDSGDSGTWSIVGCESDNVWWTLDYVPLS